MALTGCQQKAPQDVASLAIYLADPANGLVHEHTAKPWHLMLRLLPDSFLTQLQGDETTLPARAESRFASQTITLKLQVASLEKGIPVQELMQQYPVAGTATTDAQTQLLYHMQDAGHLKINNKVIKPLAAFAEVTAQSDQSVNIVFVFPFTSDVLDGCPPVDFVLDNAFFLADPIRFHFAAKDILAVMP
ncbi:hypothetical protein [Hymenobacter lucidus]|uniref:hypothetical protein n=1 Tax=Hymenobacter lucidus TaxID=2880930 RepID=UPI001CF3AEDF|nr:hypothetical protein [Hymenobacter lucidus]